MVVQELHEMAVVLSPKSEGSEKAMRWSCRKSSKNFRKKCGGLSVPGWDSRLVEVVQNSWEVVEVEIAVSGSGECPWVDVPNRVDWEQELDIQGRVPVV